MFVDLLPASEAEKILDYPSKSTGTMAVAQLRVLGGATPRLPAAATAFAHRSSRIMVNVAALFDQAGQKPMTRPACFGSTRTSRRPEAPNDSDSCRFPLPGIDNILSWR